jgi:putative endonuclease
LKKLVYYGEVDEAIEAIAHEKRVKKWRREWKITLIEEFNQTWSDLYNHILS